MSDAGWIAIHRKIQECDLWNDKPFARGQAWLDLLLLANHDDKKIFFNGRSITVERGQRITSIKSLGERWAWSRHKVSDFLNYLESEQMITQERDNRKTLITIVNYSIYQDIKSEKGHHEDTTRTSQGHHKDTNNNDNNYNNENNINSDSEKLFEHLWKLYPKKKGKGQISKTQKQKLAKIGYDKLAKAIKEYSAEVEGKDQQYTMYGSTFFNSGYVDYLEEEKPAPAPQPKEEEERELTDEEFMALPTYEFNFEDE